MAKFKQIFSLGILFVFLASCTCGVPLKVTSIQKSDKKLTCKDVILEINESEQYRQQGANEKGIGFGEALMPICWVTGFLDGDAAVKAANARIDYLGHIYDLMDCGGSGDEARSAPPPPPVAIQVQPAPPPPPVVQFAAPPPAPAQPADDTKGAVPFKKGDAPYFKELGGDLHSHMDKNGKIYVHSHPHNGPHRHLEDE